MLKNDVRLPPGQRRIEGFPRFGAHLSRPAPAVPPEPTIAVRGAMTADFDVPLGMLATLPQRQVTADFHCVAGWSSVGLHWAGVPFAAFYDAVVAPALPAGTTVTHLRCIGLDGWQAVLAIEDALADDVLIAQSLDGRPLDSDHGAPVRLVSPQQYGYFSIKHLAQITVLTAAPPPSEGPLLRSHPRGRVRHEERHGLLPGRVVRPVYRALVGPIKRLSARGAQRTAGS